MLTVTNTLLAQWYDAGQKVRDSLTFAGLNPKGFSLFQSIFYKTIGQVVGTQLSVFQISPIP